MRIRLFVFKGQQLGSFKFKGLCVYMILRRFFYSKEVFCLTFFSLLSTLYTCNYAAKHLGYGRYPKRCDPTFEMYSFKYESVACEGRKRYIGIN